MLSLNLSPNPSSVKLPQRHFKRRQLIAYEHQLLWRIDRGVVRTFTWNEEGTPVTLGFWGIGDWVGTPPAQLDPYEIECLTDVQVSLLPVGSWYSQDAMRSHLQQSGIMLKILHCKRMSFRLQQLLEWLGQRFGCPVEQGTLVDLRLTHQAIADIIGTTRVTITRLMRELEQTGKISCSGRHCILLNQSCH